MKIQLAKNLHSFIIKKWLWTLNLPCQYKWFALRRLTAAFSCKNILHKSWAEIVLCFENFYHKQLQIVLMNCHRTIYTIFKILSTVFCIAVRLLAIFHALNVEQQNQSDQKACLHAVQSNSITITFRSFICMCFMCIFTDLLNDMKIWTFFICTPSIL